MRSGSSWSSPMCRSCSRPRRSPTRRSFLAPASSGEGLDDLRSALDSAVDALGDVRNIERPRLPIDRAFSISGFGTVVTGTLIEGALEVGDSIVVEPAGLRGRIRGLQSHEQSIEHAEPGARTAVNLSGIAASELSRGMVLTAPGWLQPSQAVDVRLRVVGRHPPSAAPQHDPHASHRRRRSRSARPPARGRHTRSRPAQLGAAAPRRARCRRPRRPLRAAQRRRHDRRRAGCRHPPAPPPPQRRLNPGRAPALARRLPR